MSEESFDIDNQIREGNERAREHFKERKENTLNQLEGFKLKTQWKNKTKKTATTKKST
jgi:hypothetical protein